MYFRCCPNFSWKRSEKVGLWKWESSFINNDDIYRIPSNVEDNIFGTFLIENISLLVPISPDSTLTEMLTLEEKWKTPDQLWQIFSLSFLSVCLFYFFRLHVFFLKKEKKNPTYLSWPPLIFPLASRLSMQN
jgi:hypothetical protein